MTSGPRARPRWLQQGRTHRQRANASQTHPRQVHPHRESEGCTQAHRCGQEGPGAQEPVHRCHVPLPRPRRHPARTGHRPPRCRDHGDIGAPGLDQPTGRGLPAGPGHPSRRYRQGDRQPGPRRQRHRSSRGRAESQHGVHLHGGH